MTSRASARVHLHGIGAMVFLVLLGVFTVAGSATVSSALSGGVGKPPAAVPVVERAVADQPSVRLTVLGDVGTGEADELAVATRVDSIGVSDPFDALILLGDNVYPDGDASRLDATVFGPFSPVLDAGARLLPILGNHDVGYAAEQIAAMGMPGRWYSARMGDVLFVGLDSNDAENPAQLAWLETTLAGSDAQWKIAAMHHPPFSAGMHGSDEDVRDAFVPLFERYGVDLVLAGHDHDYQRSVPIGGVTYVVSGAGAKVRPTGSSDFTAESAAVLHFVEVAVWDDRIELTAISLDGAFDRAVLDGSDEPTVTAATIAMGGVFDDDTTTGARLASIGAALWLAVVGAGWLMPQAVLGRLGKALVVASTASMLTVLAGIGVVVASLVV